jgi:hypothetical protein
VLRRNSGKGTSYDREGFSGRASVVFAGDDDDTLLFEKLQEHVLERFPNPERIGCIDHTTLKTWVYTPEKLDLSDPKYLHVLKCAECTRELIELRRLRKEQSEPANTGVISQPGQATKSRLALLALVFLCCLAGSECSTGAPIRWLRRLKSPSPLR